jgi:MFS family permease
MEFSKAIRQKAQQRFIHIQWPNGIAVSLTFGQVIFLLALHYGANDMQMGLLYSAIHLSGLCALLVPYLFQGWQPRKLWWMANQGRSFIPLLYLTLPFFDPSWRSWMLVVIFYAFMLVRSFGFTALQPLLGAISLKRERTQVTATMFKVGNISLMSGVLLSFLFLRTNIFGGELSTYHCLLLIGCSAGFVTSMIISKLPDIDPLGKANADNGLLQSLWGTFVDQELRRTFRLGILQTALIVMVGYQVNFQRNIIGLSSDIIFLLTLAGFVAALISNITLGWIAGHVSGWALMCGSHLLIGIGALILMMSGWVHDTSILWLVLAALLIAVGLSGSGTVFFRMQTDVLPRGKEFEGSVLFQVSSVLGALLGMGMVSVVQWLPHLPRPLFHEYSWVFFCVSILSVAVIYFGAGLKGLGEAVRELTLCSPVGIWNLYRAAKVKQVPLHKRIQLMEGVLGSTSAISKRWLKSYLFSVDPIKVSSALRSMMCDPAEEHIPMLIEKCRGPYDLQRAEALTALGLHRKKELCEVFEPWLNSEVDVFRSSAIKSILRCGGEVPVQNLLDNYVVYTAIGDRLNILVALSERGMVDHLWKIASQRFLLPCDMDERTLLNISIARAVEERELMVEILDMQKEGLSLAINELASSGSVDPQSIEIYQREGLSGLHAFFSTSGIPEWLIPKSEDHVPASFLLTRWWVEHIEKP